MTHTRRIYLVVLLAMVATVLPLASIDLASAQDDVDRLSFSGGPEGEPTPRGPSSSPSPVEVAPGWPDDGEVLGEPLPTHRFTGDQAPVDDGAVPARLVTPSEPSGPVEGPETFEETFEFGGDRSPVDLVGDGAGGLRTPPGAPVEVEIPGSAGGLESRPDVAAPIRNIDPGPVADPTPEPEPAPDPEPTVTPEPTPQPTVTPEPSPSPAPTPEVSPEPTPDAPTEEATGEALPAQLEDPAPDLEPTPDPGPEPSPTPEPDPQPVGPPVDVEPGAPVEVGPARVSVAALTVDGERLVLGVDGGAETPASRAPGDSGARFDGVAGSGADVEVSVNGSGVKTTWVLDSPEQYRAGLFETLEIPVGWSAAQVGSAVEIRDAAGELVVLWAGGAVWDAEIASEFGFDASGDLNPYTLAAVAALEGATDEAEVERVLAGAVPVDDLISHARVELVDVADGVVTVRFVVDEAWLAAPERVWPVSVDPSISPSPSNGYYVRSDQPTSSYLWSSNDGFRVGRSSSTSYTSYIEFDLSTIEGTSTTINSATLELWQDYASTCSDRLIEVSRLTEAFDSSVSWNNPSAITTDGQASQMSNRGRFFCSDGHIYITVTDIVQDWSDGDTNYGFRLDGDYGSSNSYKTFENSPAPRLIVNFEDPSPGATYTPLSTPVGNYPEPGSDVTATQVGDPVGGVLPVSVTNDSLSDWYQDDICLGYRLYDTSTGNPIAGTDAVSVCPTSSDPVDPGQTWTINAAPIVVPDTVTPGLYDLKWDMAIDEGGGTWTYYSTLGVTPSAAVRIRVEDAPTPVVPGAVLTGYTPTLEVSSSFGDDVRWTLKKVSAFGDEWDDCANGTVTATTTGETWTPNQADVSSQGWYRVCTSVEDTSLDAAAVWSPWEPAWFRVTDLSDYEEPERFGQDPLSQFHAGVNVSTGGFTTSRRDFAIPTVNGELEFERFLNSNSYVDGPFGPGWSHTYSTQLVGEPYFDNPLIIYPDGRTVEYDHNGEGPLGEWHYFAVNGTDPGVELILFETWFTDIFLRWELRFPDGEVWEFDIEGKLVEISNPQGHNVDLAYNGSDQLISVTDEESGRQIRFNYDTGRIETVEVDHPDGVSAPLKWGYAYVDGFLTEACDPRGPTDPIVPGTSYCEQYNRTGGVLASIENQLGDQTHSFSVDGEGRITTMVETFATAATGDVDQPAATWTFAYPSSTTREVTDPRLNVWSYEIDTLGRVTEIESPEQAIDNTSTDIVFGTGTEVGLVVRVEDPSTRTDYDFDADFELREQVSSAAGSGGSGETQGRWYWYTFAGDVFLDCDPLSQHYFWASAILPGNYTGPQWEYCTYMTYNSDRQMTYREHPAPDGASRPSESWTYTDGSYGEPTGLVESYTDLAGVRIDYTYDADGNLTEEENASTGVRRVYTYDDWGRELTVTEYADDYPSGVVVSTTTYTVNGQVATQTGPSVTNQVSSSAHRLEVTYTYDANLHLVTIEEDDIVGTDPTRTTNLFYDTHGRLTRTEDAELGEHDTAYDGLGNVTQECDPTDRCTSYTYDKDGNVLTITADGDTSVTTTYTYDDDGRVETITDGEGRTRSFRYDYADRVIGEYLEDYDWGGGTLDELNIVTTTYNDLGQITKQEFGGRPNVDFTGWTTNPTRVIETDYGPAGLAEEVREYGPGGGSADRVTETDYNTWGAPIEVRVETSGGTVAAETRYTYATTGADRGRLTTETVENGAVDIVTTYEYDDRGHTTSIVSPRGNVTGATASDYTTSFDYDVLGRLTTTTAPPVTIDTGTSTSTGTPTTTVGYNAFGDQTHAQDPRGETVTVDFDDLGRPTITTYPTYTPPGGTAITPTEQLFYDAAGRVVKAEDRYLQDTLYAYDAVGRLETVTSPTVTLDDNGTPGNTSDDTFGTPVTTYTYDDTGAVLTVTSPNGATITNTYDEAGRLDTVTQNVAGETVPLPGGGNHTTTAVDVVVEYRYDDLGRLTHTSVPYASGATPVFAVNTYDDLGRVVTVTDPDGRVTDTTYDLLDRPTLVEDALGRATETVYDMAGRRTHQRQLDIDGDTAAQTVYTNDPDSNVTAITDPAGVVTTYTYDALGRLTDITAPHDGTGTADTSYGYDQAGNMTRTVDARGNTTTYTYQDWGLREDLIEPSTTAFPNAADRTYTTVYDAAGQVAEDRQPGSVTVTNTYDELGRLRDQTSGPASRVFMYDVAGRVTAIDHPDGPQEFHYDERNLLIASLGPAGDSTYEYDAAGRLTDRDDAAGTSTFTWTDAGLLDSLVDPQTGVTADWTYNTAGQATDIDYTPSGGGSTFGRTFTYDTAGRLVTDTHTNTSSNTVAINRMAYDPRGDLVWETQSPDPTTTGGTVTSLYGYDPADRLDTWDSIQDPDITLVVGDSASPSSSDNALKRRLEETFSATVTLRSDELSPPTGEDLIVVSQSHTPNVLNSGYESVATPLVNVKRGSWDDISLVTGGHLAQSDQTFTIADPDHPLAASLTGDEELVSSASNLHQVPINRLGSGAEVAILSEAGGNAVAFAYEEGSTLADGGAAPARRAAIGYGNLVLQLTDTGWLAFDNAIAWALTDPTATNVDTVSYGYDKNANRTSVADSTGTDTSTYDERNRLITGPEGDYTWTARGTLTEIDDNGALSTYAFDGLGRMTAANEGTAVTYTYDSLDRIAARNGSTSGFEFNGASINPTTDGNTVYTLTPSGSIFALDTPSSVAKVATLNRHGDLQRITDPTDGTTDAHNLTDPWGAPLTSNGDTPDAGYQGDYTDPDTGDIWMGARWYDPDSGTFNSRDTYPGTPNNPKSQNRNLYGEANPNKYWDPTGRNVQCTSWNPGCAEAAKPQPDINCYYGWACYTLYDNAIPGGADGFGNNLLMIGSTGPAVENWQRALAQLGFDPGPIDGIYGERTYQATLAFQQAHNLDYDGIAGTQSKSKMKQLLTGHISATPPPPTHNDTPGTLTTPAPSGIDSIEIGYDVAGRPMSFSVNGGDPIAVTPVAVSVSPPATPQPGPTDCADDGRAHVYEGMDNHSVRCWIDGEGRYQESVWDRDGGLHFDTSRDDGGRWMGGTPRSPEPLCVPSPDNQCYPMSLTSPGQVDVGTTPDRLSPGCSIQFGSDGQPPINCSEWIDTEFGPIEGITETATEAWRILQAIDRWLYQQQQTYIYNPAITIGEDCLTAFSLEDCSAHGLSCLDFIALYVDNTLMPNPVVLIAGCYGTAHVGAIE